MERRRPPFSARVAMMVRWLMWWRPKPGFVRVSSAELIRLLTDALRAQRLEASILAFTAERDERRAEVERNSRARALLVQQQAAAGVRLDAIEIEVLMRDLPRVGEGELHEPAFLAMVGNALLERRLFASVSTSGGPE